MITNALREYVSVYKCRDFPHLDAWQIARHHAKWEPIPLVDLDGPTGPRKKGTTAPRKKGGSSKRTKTAESGDYTSSTGGLSTNMPNMNLNEEPEDDPEEDTPTPTRPNRKKSGESSRLGKEVEVVSENFAEYKSARMGELAEKKEFRKEAHMLKMKREEAYMTHLSEKQKNAYLQVFLQPHDHLDEPVKSVMLQRKREICEKWGWQGP